MKYDASVGRSKMADGQRTFIDRAWDAQHALERKIGSWRKGRFARVLRMARKPEPEEFRHTSMVVVVGISIVGFIGFVIFLLMGWILGLLGAA